MTHQLFSAFCAWKGIEFRGLNSAKRAAVVAEYIAYHKNNPPTQMRLKGKYRS